MSNLTIPEAATLIHKTLDSKLPRKYWIRFIGNHARPKSEGNPFIWCQMDVINDGSTLRVTEESLQKFLEQAKDHEFPLKLIHDGYNRKDNVRIVKRREPLKVSDPVPIPPTKPVESERDRYAKEALKTVISTKSTTPQEKARSYDTICLIINLWLSND